MVPEHMQDEVVRSYERTAHALRDRIIGIARINPEILDVKDSFEMFKHGLKCSDLAPSLAQAGWALNAARKELNWERKETV